MLIYDLTFCILALVAVYISLCDLTTGCTDFQIRVDYIITIIFIVDYVVRLFISKNKKDFFKQNIFDLIAIIPFTSLFKVFRVLKVLKVLKALKILKFARLSAYFARFYKRVKFFFEINGLKYMVFASLFCIVIGGVAIHFVDGMSVFDGIWWSFVTATTVGYGDISPSTAAGRVIAAILMIVGIGLIGSLTSTITALFFQRHENASKKDAKGEILKTLQMQLDDFENLSDDDIETICKTLKSLHEQK
ncbi:potassium channel family protein [Oliverpabstia intestinalis]|uniref:potassium channel family protein n=1 Tax=Oliverpabstia intestinalis TaxID=2606633 RepID=UPI003F8A0D4A